MIPLLVSHNDAIHSYETPQAAHWADDHWTHWMDRNWTSPSSKALKDKTQKRRRDSYFGSNC